MIARIFLFVLLLFPAICFSQLSDKDKEILRSELTLRVNNLMISKGLTSLKQSDTLKKAAQIHSEIMVKNDILSHSEKSSRYATPSKRVKAAKGRDFESIGENILYSTRQNFPLRRNGLEKLAEEMFLSWKKSPGHYANMTESEYTYGDFGFKTDTKKHIVYATQVFARKGKIVEGQLSKKAFGVRKGDKHCEKVYETYSNLILNMGNNLQIEGNEVVLYFHDKTILKKMFSGSKDGLAIDFVSNDQLSCGKPNHLDMSPVYDGIMLKPYYSSDLFAQNRAKGDYRFIAKVGEIPEKMLNKNYSLSLVLIKDGRSCKYIYPAYVPRKKYWLRPFEPVINDVPEIFLLKEGIVKSQIVKYDFKTDQTISTKYPLFEQIESPIHSVIINSFSSIEGDFIHNAELHNTRADYIKNHLLRELKVDSEVIKIVAKENWEQMNFQLNYYERDDLAVLSHDSLRKLLTKKDDSLPWDSLLFNQRKSVAIINYSGKYSEKDSLESLGEFNLRTAVVNNNEKLVNKALFQMSLSNFKPEILFEPQILEFVKTHPNSVTNYSTILSFCFGHAPYISTEFIHSWLNRADLLDEDAKSNLLYLYTLIGEYLLHNWDVSSERLSNVIHPKKVEGFNNQKIPKELMLNLHLTYINYFGQINDGPNISKSFDFIADYFKGQSLLPEDDVDLALFFNYWSMFQMAVDHLLTRFETGELNEDGYFLLAQTMNFTNYKDESGKYIEVQEKALKLNVTRWCNWLNTDFQVKRNYQIKRHFCESCN